MQVLHTRINLKIYWIFRNAEDVVGQLAVAGKVNISINYFMSHSNTVINKMGRCHKKTKHNKRGTFLFVGIHPTNTDQTFFINTMSDIMLGGYSLSFMFDKDCYIYDIIRF